MLRRRLIAPAVALVAASAVVACTAGGGAATPTPTAPPEDEAYAAAESAFRAYIDALNQIDIADPETFQPAFALTTGRLNAQDRRAYSERHANGWSESGDFVVASVSLIDGGATSVDLSVCLDQSEIVILDANGLSQVQPDRLDVQALDVQVDKDGDGWRVARIQRDDSGPAC